MRWPLRALAFVVLLLAAGTLGIRARYGGGDPFPDRSSQPLLPGSALETVANLDLPPGNLAVSREGRIFFSFHPEAFPDVKVAELVDGEPHPYPSAAMQEPDGPEEHFQSVLSLRIDRQGRLWVLDYADHGTGQPRILAFDLATDAQVHRHDFTPEAAPIGSHLNDFQVSPDGTRIYIADASIFGQRSALLVYDLRTGTARRLLEGHPSVTPQYYVPIVEGRKMLIFGIFAIRPGVDSIALDREGEWLYFAPVTNEELYRVRTRDLNDTELSAAELGTRVEAFAAKTMSDGITTDLDGGIYLTDLEHSAIIRLDPGGSLQTLLRDPRLRWPDGLSFGPDGWLYVACSALQHVIMQGPANVEAHAPYQIFRFKPPYPGIPGH